jgi:Mrp family chromosome partitioning ATPase
MLRRRGRPPTLAELPAASQGEPRPGSLRRAELGALAAVLDAVGEARVVLATGTGRSELATGLATVAATRGRRAALVECDLAAPVLASRLGLEPAPGLHEYLRREADAAQILQPLVLAGPAAAAATAPLTCIAAGAPTADASELLAAEGFGHAIAKLRSAYDLVVVAAPPLDEELSLLAVAARTDKALACGLRSEVPRRSPIRLDGLVVQA